MAKQSEDVQKSRYSHQDWRIASETVSSQLEQKLKEPHDLLFFKGAIYEITFNSDGKFSNIQLAILYDLPSADDLSNWRPINVLKCPIGEKEIEFDPAHSKDYYLNLGYEEVNIGVAPDRTQYLSNNTQAKRKQYGLRHYVTSTIHACQGDTIPHVATEISETNAQFKMWDKGQMIVILSRTKYAKNTIFVGDRNDTINALRMLLTRKTQWKDYMEDVISKITISTELERRLSRHRVLTQHSFPFRIRDISLPQCNTGYVYMLISVKDTSFSYIGKTKSIRNRIRQHNSGVGLVATEPLHLRPYALFAYICGFDSKNDIIFYMERVWKERRDQSIRNGVNDIKAWARCGAEIIEEMDEQNFGVKPTDLTLVCLFSD